MWGSARANSELGSNVTVSLRIAKENTEEKDNFKILNHRKA